jgi:hypothetical protein
MSQKGRREFLTSAAAVAAALAACTAPARRAQAACGSIYDEAGIVKKVAPLVHDIAFQNNLLTFPANNLQPTWDDLYQNLQLVDDTWQTLNHHQITTVTVKNPPPNLPLGLPPGMYDLIPSNKKPVDPQSQPPQHGKRWPVVLTLEQQQTGSFNPPDWTQILLFVIPHPRDRQGQPISTDDATAAMCVHPYGM